MTNVIEVRKTKLPMAFTCGSILPVTISKITTGIVLLSPDINQAIANSSNDTAAVRQKDEIIAGRQNGIITRRRARHWLAPRFHAADSRLSSIWLSLNRIIAMAKGAVNTVWAMIIENTCPESPTLANQASMASAIIINGMVGGKRINAR